MSPFVPSPRFEDALVYATRLHASQYRKGAGTPYITHLYGVLSLVLEHHGNEDEAIGALLHDAAEDQGGIAQLNTIRERYGDTVAEIVAGCTDTFETPKPEWLPRKKAYIAGLPHHNASTLLVSAADKLYNARAILSDLTDPTIGDTVWQRFSAPAGSVLRYYQALATAYHKTALYQNHPPFTRLVNELQRTVETLIRLSISPPEPEW